MATIQNYVRPQRLYRYRSIKSYLDPEMEVKNNLDREIEAIEHACLYCARYTQLNDPMEGTFRSSSSLRQDDRYRNIKSEIIDEKSQTGICSFTEVQNHELMWAHYADQFAGICVAYNFSMLLRYLPEHVSFVRMYYSEKVPVVRHSHLQPDQPAKMILSYKNYRWLYEREWRMFGQIGSVSYRKINCVTHVYLGSKIAPEHKDRITRAMLALRIKVSDMRVSKYALSFV